MLTAKLELIENTVGDDLLAFMRAVAAPDQQFRRTVADVVRQEYQRRFDAQNFAPLAPATIADRIRNGYGAGPVLIRKGDLLRSYTVPGASGHVEQVTSTGQGISIEVGSAHRLAELHQRGTSRMPARPVADLPSEAQDRILDAVQTGVQRIERGTLGRVS